MKNISYDQAIKLVRNNNGVLLDVQLERDYYKRHLPSSINIPVEEINQKANKLIMSKNEFIVVYCLSGIRSVAACDMLKRLGYNNIYNIEGGIDN